MSNPKIPHFYVAGLLNDHQGDWRKAIRDLGVDAFTEVAGPAFYELIDAVAVRQRRPIATPEVERYIHELATQAVEVGALFGYCLGRTVPTGIEDLNGWPARAWLLAGLKVANEPEAQP